MVSVSGRAHSVDVPGMQKGDVAAVRALIGKVRPFSLSTPSRSTPAPTTMLLTPFRPLSPPFSRSGSIIVTTEASANLAGSRHHDARVAMHGASVCVSVKPVVKRTADTHTVASKLLRPYAAVAYSLLPAVGLVYANDAHRSSGPLANHNGSSNIRASTAAMLLWAV